jgi:hypothetical protein
MVQLNQDKQNHFLSRFYGASDGVVRSVTFDFNKTDPRNTVTIVLSVRDSERDPKESWVNLRLIINQVDDYCFCESSNVGYQVLSSGIQAGRFSNLYYFDFDPYTLEPDGVEDYRKSKFYFAGHEFSWAIEAYSEARPAVHASGQNGDRYPLSLLADTIYSILRRRVPATDPGITYKELTQELPTLPPPFDGVQPRDRRLWDALGEIVNACRKHNFPALPSIVIQARRKDIGPGRGYYYIAYPGIEEEQDLKTQWAREYALASAFSYPPHL